MMIQELFLNFVRSGIGTNSEEHNGSFPQSQEEWSEIRDLASKQGLSAIVVDGIKSLQLKGVLDYLPEKRMLMRWIGEVMQNYEYRYDSYRRAIAELAGFYNSHGIKMMVLKGYACALDWPKSEHRPMGDIDIWLFGDYKKADAILASEVGIEFDNSHHHHTVFNWHEYVVENHYDFINVHARKSNRKLEALLKELGKDDSYFVEELGNKVYLPSPNLHALFLIRHMVAHFSSVSISLRQVLDWAFFVNKHSAEVNWKWLLDVLDEYHMTGFFNCINSICVEDLGFDASKFPHELVIPGLKDRVLSDILFPQFEEQEPETLKRRLLYKYKRWRGNAWKHDLCFKESRFESFVWGAWMHLLKPKSI